MNLKRMKHIILKAIKKEKKRLRKENMDENKELRRAFIASAVALVVVGIVFVATMIIVLGQLTKVTVDSKANMYDMNCVTQPIEKPLEECRK